ncbi:hypothetical protein ACS0TY_006516 [Phlomoides rotata]
MQLYTNLEYHNLFSFCRYPEGKPLVTIFVHRSPIEMLDASVDNDVECSSW